MAIHKGYSSYMSYNLLNSPNHMCALTFTPQGTYLTLRPPYPCRSIMSTYGYMRLYVYTLTNVSHIF